MDENTKSNLNLYDYVGFPNPQQRAEAKKFLTWKNFY